jgi:hypothetical protein
VKTQVTHRACYLPKSSFAELPPRALVLTTFSFLCSSSSLFPNRKEKKGEQKRRRSGTGSASHLLQVTPSPGAKVVHWRRSDRSIAQLVRLTLYIPSCRIHTSCGHIILTHAFTTIFLFPLVDLCPTNHPPHPPQRAVCVRVCVCCHRR